MAGRMLKWSLELSEFDIRYESRKAFKAKVLADFVAEMTTPAPSSEETEKWTIFVDGASSSTGAGAGSWSRDHTREWKGDSHRGLPNPFLPDIE
jgi:hypothetical protein